MIEFEKVAKTALVNSNEIVPGKFLEKQNKNFGKQKRWENLWMVEQKICAKFNQRIKTQGYQSTVDPSI